MYERRCRDSFDSIAEIREIITYHLLLLLLLAQNFFFPPFPFSRSSSRTIFFSFFETVYASNWDTCQLELVTVAREKGRKGCVVGEKKKKKIEEEAKIQVSIG